MEFNLGLIDTVTKSRNGIDVPLHYSEEGSPSVDAIGEPVLSDNNPVTMRIVGQHSIQFKNYVTESSRRREKHSISSNTLSSEFEWREQYLCVRACVIGWSDNLKDKDGAIYPYTTANVNKLFDYECGNAWWIVKQLIPVITTPMCFVTVSE